MSKIVPTELGSEKISVLLKKYAIPAIIAMTATSIYNLVDAIYIGHGLGAFAISGLAITFPFMNIQAAFGMLVGVGASTILSVLLGQKNYKMAEKVLGNVVMLNIVIGLFLTVVCLSFINPILGFFGASTNTLPYARDYMVVLLAGNLISCMYWSFNAILRAAGHPKQAMVSTIMTVCINAALDPIFIFAFHMGIRGAAIGTLLAQGIALIYLVKILSNKNEVVHLEKGIYKFNKKIDKEILNIGMSPFLMNIVASGVIIIINLQLKRYGGDLYIGAYGIVNRIAFLFLMIVFGFNQGLQPIVGYNYGAQQKERVIEGLKLTLVLAEIVMLTGFISSQLFPKVLVGAFTTDPKLLEIAIVALKYTMLAFPVVTIQAVGSNFFQSLGKSRKALFLSLSRQLIFFVPLLFIMPLFNGTEGVWMAFPMADILAAVITAVTLLKFIKTYRKGPIKLKILS